MEIKPVGDDIYESNAKSFIAAMGELSKKQQERIDGAIRIANEYKTKGAKFIVTDYDGIAGVVGLMILTECKEEKNFKIEEICTHPCTKGVGRKLVEHAVNISCANGYMGNLKITDMSSSSFYNNLGFKSEDDSIKKILEPAKSEKWKLDEELGFVLK